MIPLRRTYQLSVRTRCMISLLAVLLTGLAASPAQPRVESSLSETIAPGASTRSWRRQRAYRAAAAATAPADGRAPYSDPWILDVHSG